MVLLLFILLGMFFATYLAAWGQWVVEEFSPVERERGRLVPALGATSGQEPMAVPTQIYTMEYH
jgi:hypothetical protein